MPDKTVVQDVQGERQSREQVLRCDRTSIGLQVQPRANTSALPPRHRLSRHGSSRSLGLLARV